MMNIPYATDMFLSAPGSSSASGKTKALLIQDFVSKVTAEEEENVIQSGQNTRLSVNVGYKRPKLSEITVSEWNVAYHLMIKFYFTLLKLVGCQLTVTLNHV